MNSHLNCKSQIVFYFKKRLQKDALEYFANYVIPSPSHVSLNLRKEALRLHSQILVNISTLHLKKWIIKTK